MSVSAKSRHDEKNLAEHDFVVKMIHDSFCRAAADVKKPAGPQLYKTKSVQHLYTPITGHLKTSASLFDLIEKPASHTGIGRSSQQKAVEIIADIEPMTRGWYAAPIGWMDGRENGEFVGLSDQG